MRKRSGGSSGANPRSDGARTLDPIDPHLPASGALVMTDSWYAAQDRFVQDWRAAVAATPFGAGLPPDLVDRWQATSEQWLAAVRAGAQATASATAQQMGAGQQQLLYFAHLFIEAWQAMVAAGGAGAEPAEWDAALERYLAQLRAGWQANSKSQTNTQLWQLYWEELHKWMAPWLEASPHAAAAWSRGDWSGSAALFGDAYGQSFGRLLLAPGLGLLREFNVKAAANFQLWLECRQLEAAYLTMLWDAWLRAFATLLRRLRDQALAGAPVQTLRSLFDLWLEVADAEYLRLFESEGYVTAQAKLLNHTMELKLHQQELLEVGLRVAGLPTRSELEEAQKTIFELRKELKALRKQVDRLAAQQSACADT
jgi:polyhydroxyalkanoate synthase subunit PhaE